MRIRNKTILVLITAVILLGGFAIGVKASFNEQINYQGKITDGSNQAVSDGAHCFKFKIFDAATNGNELWSEEWSGANTATTDSGLFSVMLGTHTSLSGVDFNQTSLYLEVQYDDECDASYETFSPRKRLGAVPAAFEAKQLGGYSWATPDAIGSATPNTGAFTTLSATGNVSFDGGTFIFNESGADKDFRIEGSGDANLFFTDAANDRIGIGTASPSVTLEASGDAIITGTATFDSTLHLATGSITDSGGTIDFGDEDLTTTGSGRFDGHMAVGNVPLSTYAYYYYDTAAEAKIGYSAYLTNCSTLSSILTGTINSDDESASIKGASISSVLTGGSAILAGYKITGSLTNESSGQTGRGFYAYLSTENVNSEATGFYDELQCNSIAGTHYAFYANADYSQPTLDNFYAFYAKAGLLTANNAKWGVYILDLDSYFGGKVGIGTASPSVTLEASGDAIITGTATFDSTLHLATGSITDSGGTIDFSDNNLTSIDKLEGYDSGVYIDLGADGRIVMSADGAGTPFSTPDIDITGTGYFDDDWGFLLDKKLMFGDTAVYILSDDDGHLDFTADVSIDLNAAVVLSSSLTMAENQKIYFDSTDTYIYANTDNPEDLVIGADQDILFEADDNVIITGADGSSSVAPDVLVVIGGTGGQHEAGLKGSDILLTSGQGGPAEDAGYSGGAGGDVEITTGAGGNVVPDSVGDGGGGGSIKLTTGAGRAGNVAGGSGGDIELTTGAGGTGEAGGNIELTTGAYPGGAYGNIYLAKNGGLVGIGTASPSVTLEASGDAIITGTATFDSTLHLATGSVTDSGGTIDFGDNDLTSIDKLEGYDSGVYIDLGANGVMDLNSDGDININTGTLDLSNQTVDVTLNNAIDAFNFDSNTLSIDASNDRIGIGTASPSEALDLASGNLTTTGTGTFGSLDVDTLNFDGNIITDSTGTVRFNDMTEIRDTDNASGILLYLAKTGYDLSGANSQMPLEVDVAMTTPGAKNLYGLRFYVKAKHSSGNQGANLYGITGNAWNEATGTGTMTSSWAALAGASFSARQCSDNALTSMWGVATELNGLNGKTGAVTNAIEFYAKGVDAEDTDMENAYNFYGSTHKVDAGDLNNAYGLYLETQTAGTTLNYAIYSAGGDSVHAGDFRIGSTTAPGNTLDVTGGIRVSTLAGDSATHVCRDGSNDLSTCSADISEYAPTSDDVGTGDLVVISKDKTNPIEDPEAPFLLEKSIESYQTNLIGVIADIVAGASIGTKKAEHYKPLVLVGRIPVKVSTENGNIEPGDYLTSSLTPGVAMKATERGPVIGKALESYSSDEIGNIMVFVNLGWYGGQLAKDGSLADGTGENDEGLSQRQPLGNFVQRVKQALASLGLFIENGVAQIKEVIAEKVIAKTARIDKLEMVDQETGEAFCTWLENGEWQKVKGECLTETLPQEAEQPEQPEQPQETEEPEKAEEPAEPEEPEMPQEPEQPQQPEQPEEPEEPFESQPENLPIEVLPEPEPEPEESEPQPEPESLSTEASPEAESGE